MVAAFDSGRIYNPKLAESQWIGGMVMGLGQALLEEGLSTNATAVSRTPILPTTPSP